MINPKQGMKTFLRTSVICFSLTCFFSCFPTSKQKADFYYNKGVLKNYLFGSTTWEIEDYNKAIELDPEGAAEAYNNRGMVKANSGDFVGAIEDFTESINLSPHATPYTNRGWAKSNLDDKLGAVEDYSVAIELDPKQVIAYHNRGLNRFYLDDSVGSLKDLNIAIELKPDWADSYYYRGLAKDDLGDRVGAIKDYDKVIALDPKNTKVYASRGMSKASIGDLVGGLKDLQTSLALGDDRALFGIEMIENAIQWEKEHGRRLNY